MYIRLLAALALTAHVPSEVDQIRSWSRYRIIQALPPPLASTLRWVRSRGRRQLSADDRWEIYARISSHMSMVDPLYEWLVESGFLERAESLFSIGPGSGALELRLAKEFHLTVGYAEYTAAFRESLEASAEAAGLTNRIVERQEGPYRADRLTRRYDLIISSGSWYEAGYDRSILDQTLSALSPNGVLIISLSSRDDFFVAERIRRRTAMTAEDFADWLGSEGVEYELYRVEQRLPTDLLLESGQLTNLAQDVLSFFTHRHWDTVPLRDRDRFKTSLIRNEKRRFFNRVRGIVVLPGSRRPPTENQQSH